MKCSPRDTPTDRGDGRPGRRGTSEVVGVVLLFGMVLAGAMIVFLASGTLLDSVESEAQSEQVELQFGAAADQIYQAVGSGTARSIPDTDARRQLNENSTEVTITRINASDAADPGDDPTYSELQSSWQCGQNYEQPIHALEYHLDDRNDTYVFEGGGQWRVSGGMPMVHTPPRFEVAYDNETGTRIDLVSFDADSDIQEGELTAEPSTENAVNDTALQEALECSTANPATDPVAGDVMIEVDSEYVEAWDSYLQDSSSVATDEEEVHYYPPEDTDGQIVIVIEDQLVPAFEVTDIDADEMVVFEDEELSVEATVENVGNFRGKTDVDIAVAESHDGPEDTTETSMLEPGESEEIEFTFPSDGDLQEIDVAGVDGVDYSTRDEEPWQYDEYQWNVTTVDGNASGEFFLTYDDSFYRIDDVSHDVGVDEVEIETDFVNIGNETGNVVPEYTVTVENEELDEPITWESDPANTDPIQVDSWNDSTFSFDINRSKAPFGEYQYEINFTQNEPFCTNAPQSCVRTGSFELTEGSGVGVSADELELGGETDVNASLIGTEITNEGSVADGDDVQVFENFLGSGDDIPVPQEQLVFRDSSDQRVPYSEVDPTFTETPAGGGDVSINVLAPPPGGNAPDYQDPTAGDTRDCYGWYGCYNYRYINGVTFGSDISVTSGNDNGYGDYTSHAATVEPGSSYTLEVDVYGDDQHVSAWFDFDGDGSFDDDERMYLGSTTQGTVSTTVDVPSNVSDGGYQFRIVQQQGEEPTDPDPGPSDWDGEAEDYGFLVSPESPPKNPTGGWVDPAGSDPQWNGNEWVWNPATIQWSDDGGYDLQIGQGGDYAVSGANADHANFEDVNEMQQLEPLTASVVASDPDSGDEIQRLRFQPDGSVASVSESTATYEDNLNGFETQYEAFEFSAQMEGVVTFEATMWECDQWGYGGVDQNEQAGGETYYAVECVDYDDDYTRVDVSGSDTAGPEDGFIRTRDAQNNTVENPDALLPTQRNFEEIFEDGTDDIDLQGGELTLDDKQVAFMMELEMALGTNDPGSCDINDLPDGLLGSFAVDDTEPNSWAPSYAQEGGEYAEYTQTTSPDYSGINLAAWDIAQNYAYDGDSSSPGDDINEANHKFLYGDCGNLRDTRPNFNDAVGLIEVDQSLDPGDPIENETVDGEQREPSVDAEDVDAPDGVGGIDIGVDEVHLG